MKKRKRKLEGRKIEESGQYDTMVKDGVEEYEGTRQEN